MIWKILGLFGNTFTANDKYFLLSRGNLLQDFQMQLSRKEKTFSEFLSVFLHFSNLESVLNILKKKKALIADVFLN